MGVQPLNLLLDTHAWLWAAEDPERLGSTARELLVDTVNTRYVSPVSTLESARLMEAGSIILSLPLLQWVRRSREDLILETLPLTHEIASESYSLAGEFHRDPADRQLVATARLRNCTFLTADERILAYPHVATQDCRI